jgi:hypothetical protein
MQPAVERVIRAFTIKHPLSEAEAKVVRQEATELAAELLEEYKTRLVQRARNTKGHRPVEATS